MSCKICHKEIRSDNLSRHIEVHIKYTPEDQSIKQSCRVIMLKIWDKVVDSTQEQDRSGMKRKLEEDDDDSTQH